MQLDKAENCSMLHTCESHGDIAMMLVRPKMTGKRYMLCRPRLKIHWHKLYRLSGAKIG
ncbi:MAG: hypothetical protein WAW41_12015 [Methylobacter sp.]